MSGRRTRRKSEEHTCNDDSNADRVPRYGGVVQRNPNTYVPPAARKAAGMTPTAPRNGVASTNSPANGTPPTSTGMPKSVAVVPTPAVFVPAAPSTAAVVDPLPQPSRTISDTPAVTSLEKPLGDLNLAPGAKASGASGEPPSVGSLAVPGSTSSTSVPTEIKVCLGNSSGFTCHLLID
jgi:hypothetical protein